MPKNPTRDGYTFDGWYLDKGCLVGYDFNLGTTKKSLIYREIKKEGVNYKQLYYPEDYVTFIYAKWNKI